MKRDGEGSLDPGDEYAVEAALQLAEASEGEVTVVSMGPEGAVAAIRRALSMGAHRAIVVTDDALRGADVLATARVLAAAVGRRRVRPGADRRRVHRRVHGHPARCRSRSCSASPAVTFARKVEVADGGIRVERQTEAGYDVVRVGRSRRSPRSPRRRPSRATRR